MPGKLGVESVIPAVQRRADGKVGGKWRSKMKPKALKKAGFGRRWGVESFFSALKRTMGSALSARNPKQMIAEAAFKVLAYTLKRWGWVLMKCFQQSTSNAEGTEGIPMTKGTWK